MKKVAKKSRKKVEPVHVEPQYTLGLGYNPADPAQSLDTILGKHQARYMENIFNEMNKFTKTAVMTVVPDLFAQLLNVLKQEKQRLIAEQLDAEAGGDDEAVIVSETKNEIAAPLKVVKEAEIPATEVDPNAPKAKKE